jgi:diphthamide synthase (EF-2-diphthine--ammonia ligase)
MEALFPLWMENTYELAFKFINLNFKTHICSIDASRIPKDLIGVDYSEDFIKQLPREVDSCGENGEFHSFCYEGPIFKSTIKFKTNGIVEKSYSHKNKEHLYLFSDITSS